MRRLTGQAARHFTRVLHALCTVTLLAVVVTSCVVAVLAWRLSQGPLNVQWLAHRMEAAVNAGSSTLRLKIGTAAIAWEGFRAGVDMPLEVRLTGVSATDDAGVQVADVPRAEVSLSPGSLLLGELRPRAIDVYEARLRLERSNDGSISIDLGSLTAADAPVPPQDEHVGPGILPGLITELARPADNDRAVVRRSLIGQLRHLHIRDASVVVVDHQLGATWRMPRLDLLLDRLSHGGLEGRGDAELALGDQQTSIHLTAALAPGTTTTELEARLGPVQPAAVSRLAPALGALSAVDAAVSATIRADLGPQLALRQATLEATVGTGQARIGPSVVQLAGGSLAVDATPGEIVLRNLSLGLRPHEGGTLSQIQGSGHGRRGAQGLEGNLSLGVDQVGFADLATYWPEDAGKGARRWVTQNITAGMARNAHVDVKLTASPGMTDLALASATGTMTGDGLTVYWLRPVPPVERAQARLNILDPDTLEILPTSGQQRSDDPSRGDPLMIRGGKIRVTGIEHPHQFGAIDAEISGGLAETLALLKQPRLGLLDKHPIPGRDPTGKVSGKVSVQVPFEDKVKIDDIAIRAHAHLDNAGLADLIAGHALTNGSLDLDASNDGLKMGGNAALAGIATQLALDMDFRAGPPAQVLQRISASGRATTRQLANLGVDAGPTMSGSADMQVQLTERRDGKGAVEADADLADMELDATPVGWRKPVGSPARLSASVALDHDKLAGINALSLEGKDVSVRGNAETAEGHVSVLRLDRVVLGQTQAQGTVRFPPPGQRRPIEAAFNGPVIDLSAVTEHRAPSADKQPQGEAPPGPAWTLDARFARAMMAGQHNWLGLAARAENNGERFQILSVSGQTEPGQPFQLNIAPDRNGRSLSGTAADAGALFAGLDLIKTMQGGRLSLSGWYDDGRPDHALSGTADITDFRVKDPNGLGRLLQAMTLYGLVQAASGPGLGFSRLTAPFTLTADRLDLGESRAFSPSLGVTATGHIDLRRNVCNIDGTIVPAYFFNSLLGHVPVIGRLFSPEAGGGLFAATYTVQGPLSDPKVSVNPLSTLTPGFLRGVFGLF